MFLDSTKPTEPCKLTKNSLKNSKYRNSGKGKMLGSSEI